MTLNSNDKPSSKSYWLSDWRCLSFTFILKFRIVNRKLNLHLVYSSLWRLTCKSFLSHFHFLLFLKPGKCFDFVQISIKVSSFYVLLRPSCWQYSVFRPSAFLEAPSFAVPFVEHAQVHSFKYWVDISIFSHLVLPPATYMKKVAIRSYLSCRVLF